MTAERCPICDRPDCQRFVRKADGRRITSRMFLDCQMHPVDWRSRALAAEGRLRTAEQTIPVLIAKIEYWASQEDGVPEEVWRPYMTMKNWAAAHPEDGR